MMTLLTVAVVAAKPVVLVTPTPALAAWFAANSAVVVTGACSVFAAVFSWLAMKVSNKNHALATQIHVDTNGRLSTALSEIAALKQDVQTAIAVAAATKIGTDKAAGVAAIAVEALAAAPAAAATAAAAPPAGERRLDSVITGTVDPEGVLNAEAHGVTHK